MSWKNVDDLTDLSYPFPLLEADAQHRVQIYAVDGDGLAGPTSSVTFYICSENFQANSDRTACAQDVLSESSIIDNLKQPLWYGIGILILVASLVIFFIFSRGGHSDDG
jgi:hypothetical protein